MQTMSKVQKIVQNVQQMAPMLKVLMASFGKKKAAESDAPRRKRRKRKGGPSAAGKRKRKRSSGR
ncbi:hypothetical protein D3C71_1789150 [compost metagenome]